MILLAIIVVISVTAFYFIRRQYTHWKIEGIPYITPSFPFGNLSKVVSKTRSFGTTIYELYKQSKEPFVGIYLFFTPAILIRDAELVKHVLVKDFEHFHDRGVYCDDVNDKMSATLFGLPGDKWRKLRQTLTPVFTSGKLKSMFQTLLDTGNKLLIHLDPIAEKNGVIEIKSMSSRYVLDVLVSH
jgi:cytochrome P450 family 6